MDLSNGAACADTGESSPGTPADTNGDAEAARNSLRFTKLPRGYFLWLSGTQGRRGGSSFWNGLPVFPGEPRQECHRCTAQGRVCGMGDKRSYLQKELRSHGADWARQLLERFDRRMQAEPLIPSRTLRSILYSH